MNYDDPIFKTPSLPTKRKAPPGPPTPNKHPRIEDDDDHSPPAAVAPGGDDDGDEADEEGGRFYGSGVSSTQAEILSYLDKEDGVSGDGEVIGAEEFADRDVRKLASALDKAISFNEARRSKYDNPAMFMDSEADLFGAVTSFSFLSEHPNLYPTFVDSGALSSMKKLLAHENVDIAISVLEVLVELTGEDVEYQKEEDMVALIDGLFKDDGMEVMMGNLERLDESVEDDRRGVFHTLTILENITSFRATYASLVPQSLLQWILRRLQKKERPISQNKQYAAEILSIILHLSPAQLSTFLTLHLPDDPLDILLTQLSPYRKRDPDRGSDEEEEFVENVFDCVYSIVRTVHGKRRFVALEGVELAILCLTGEGKVVKARALKVLDFAVGGVGSQLVATKIVEAGGLKILFQMFMRNPSPETSEHLIGIFVSLFRHLPPDSAERLRFLIKFAEKEYEKIAVLLKIREVFISKLARVDVELAEEERDPEEGDEERRQRWYLRKVEDGGFVVQLCALLLGWLAVEDKGMREFILQKVELDEIRETIKEQLENAEDAEEGDDDVTKENAREEKEIMQVLIDILGKEESQQKKSSIPVNGDS